MQIFKSARKIILLIIVFVMTFNTFVFAGVNPPREELELMIEEVAEKRGIPAILLKAIARVESCYEHYDYRGNPRISGTSIGLMQINNRYGGYDSHRLKYDILYNIEAGADVLLSKWSMSSYKQVSSVGNMDPNVLENWYFALWAYNGWAQSNNPHMLHSYAKRFTYQQLVYDIIEKEYDGKINNIDFSYLPATGKPSRSLVVPTPVYTNRGGIVLYEKGDYVRIDGIRGTYHLRDGPAGKYTHDLGENHLGSITEGPVLQNGYYWYKVYIDESTQGWIERNFLLRTGDSEYGKYIFEDISFHWARKVIMNLYGKDIISQAKLYNPDNNVSREEFYILLSKTLDYADYKEIAQEPLVLANLENLNSWAVEYVEDVYELGLIDEEDLLNPLTGLSRKEAAVIIEGLFEISEEFSSLNIEDIFSDISNLSEEEINAIKTAYTNGIMSGKSSVSFSPDSTLTRAEAAAIMLKISESL